MERSLLLLGAGHAHVHVLQDLARQPLSGFKLSLVTPYGRQMYSGMVPGMVAGHYSAEQSSIGLSALIRSAGATWHEELAVGLDAAKSEVTLADGQRLHFDLLSLDTGAVMHRDGLPGAAEHALFVRPIEEFALAVDALVQRAAKTSLDVVLVGGGAAGVELAMALQYRFSRLSLAPGVERSRVALVTGGAAPLSGYSDGVMQRAAQTLSAQRIPVFTDQCAQITPTHVVLAGGGRLACDVAVVATGAQAPRWLQGSGLALDERGFVQTGATLQSRSHANVFAVGDVASRVDVQHPKSGVYAVRAGPPLAVNLRRWAGGQSLQAHAPQQRTLNLISCGRRSAIVSWGGLHAQGRWAWWWKDRIDRAFIARYHQAAPAVEQGVASRQA